MAQYGKLEEPERGLKTTFVRMLHAILDEDVNGLMTHFQRPVKDGARLVPLDQIKHGWQERFNRLDYGQLKLTDVVDPQAIQVRSAGEGRFRVFAPTKIKYLKGEMYFDDELWFVYEKNTGKWLVIEMD